MWEQQATTNQKKAGNVKRKEETPVHVSYQPPRIFAGIYLGWVSDAHPGSTVSQSDWPETVQKLT